MGRVTLTARLAVIDRSLALDQSIGSDGRYAFDGVPPGEYRLAIGLYHPEARLTIVAPQGWTVSGDRLLLAEPLRIP